MRISKVHAKTGMAVICSAFLLQSSPVLAEDLEVLLGNLSSRDLHHLQVSQADSESWEEDLLGDTGILPAGNEVPVIIADGLDVCIYDMRFIMEDGTSLEHYGVDLCDTESYTLYDD